jgi:hypothetical protein
MYFVSTTSKKSLRTLAQSNAKNTQKKSETPILNDLLDQNAHHVRKAHSIGTYSQYRTHRIAKTGRQLKRKSLMLGTAFTDVENQPISMEMC